MNKIRNTAANTDTTRVRCRVDKQPLKNTILSVCFLQRRRSYAPAELLLTARNGPPRQITTSPVCGIPSVKILPGLTINGNSQPNYYGELFMGSYLVQASTVTIPETGWLFMSA